MNVGELRSLMDELDLSDNVKIKVGAIEVKEANVKGNSLSFDLDYSKKFYTANGEIYTYEYIINKLKRLNFFENGEPINVNRLNSIGITTANNFYMLDLEKIQSSGEKLTLIEFLREIPEIDDIENYELYVNEYNDVANVIVDNVNKRIVFLAKSNNLQDYYNNRHKELVIMDTVEHIVSEGINQMQQIEVELLAEHIGVSYQQIKEALENKGINVVELLK